MPPQTHILWHAMNEILLLKERYDHSFELDQQITLYDQLHLHLLELPDILSRDASAQAGFDTTVLETFRTWPYDAFGASRLLRDMLVHEKARKRQASQRQMQPARDSTNRINAVTNDTHPILSVVVSGNQLNYPIGCAAPNLDITYDAPSARYHIRHFTNPLPMIEPDAHGIPSAIFPPAQGGPALSFAPTSVINVRFESRTASLNIEHVGTQFNRGCVSVVQYKKQLDIEFPNVQVMRAFLEEVGRRCWSGTLPLWNALPGWPYTHVDKPRRLRSFYDLKNISVGGDMLIAAQGERSLLLSIHHEEENKKRVVVLGPDGVSCLEWAKYTFLVSEVNGMGWGGKRVSVVLQDETTVDIEMREEEDAERFQGVIWDLLEKSEG